MKKILFLLATAAIFHGCSKDSPSVPDPNNAPAVSAVPDHFQQKILVESFTQTFCGQCPKANIYLDSMVRFNPDRVYGVALHINDPMSDTSLNQTFSGTNYYDSLFNPIGVYPAGMVNRHITSLTDLSPDLWPANVFTSLQHVPSCGVAIEAEDVHGASLNLTVHVGFSANMFGQYRFHAYIVQDAIQSNDSTYDQLNDFSSQGATPDSTYSLYWMNDTIHLYSHHYVLKKVVTPDGVDGTIIPESIMLKGNDFIKTFPVSLSGINTNNSFIIVFVDKYSAGISGHWIENVQRVAIGQSKDWN
jgi:hypothetical protein